MASITDICNGALALLGKPDITSIDEQSAAAGWCRRWYDVARKDVLRRSDWTFARGYADLLEVDASGYLPEAGETSYLLPNDALKVRAVGSGTTPYRRGGGGVPWSAISYDLRGRRVYVSGGAARVWYTRDVLNPDDWSVEVQQAVSAKLAAMVAPRATGRPKDAADLTGLAEALVRKAIEVDASQEVNVYGEPPGYSGGLEADHWFDNILDKPADPPGSN